MTQLIVGPTTRTRVSAEQWKPSPPLSVREQLLNSSGTLYLADPADTTSYFQRMSYGPVVQGADDELRAIANLKGLGPLDFQTWVDAQPNQAAQGSFNTSGEAELLSDTSFRFVRTATSVGAVAWTPPTPGVWYIEGDIAAYDGANPEATRQRMFVSNNYANSTGLRDTNNPGPFSHLLQVDVQMIFNGGSSGDGATITNFKAVKIADYHVYQPTIAYTPTYDLGRSGDGVDDFMILAQPVGGWGAEKMDFTFIIKSLDSAMTLLAPAGGPSTIRAISTQASLAFHANFYDVNDPGEILVDGVSIGDAATVTQQELNLAIGDGVAHTLTLTKIPATVFPGDAHMGMHGTAFSAYYAVSDQFDLVALQDSSLSQPTLVQAWANSRIEALGL